MLAAGAVPGGGDFGFCRYRFTHFDNMVEREKHVQVFSELNAEINAYASAHVEVLYANDEVPEWNTSPSYPPQVLVNPEQAMFPGQHPGFDDWLARHPSLAPTFAGGAIFVGRPFGVGGPPGDRVSEEGFREYDTYRVAASLDGVLDNGMGYDVGVTWSESRGERETDDTFINRFNLAFDGLGGPDRTAIPPPARPASGPASSTTRSPAPSRARRFRASKACRAPASTRRSPTAASSGNGSRPRWAPRSPPSWWSSTRC